MNIVEKIVKLAEDRDNAKIIVFTETFKVLGKLYIDKDFEKGILTLKDATICDCFEDCDFGDDCVCEECGCEEYPNYDWLNIIDEKIVAFSLIK